MIEKARAVGVPVPVNEALNREIKAIEASWKNVDAPVVDMLCAHTSVRDYTDEPVSEAMRQKILDAVFAASSSCFLQLVTVIRVTDPELRRVMYEASGNQPQVLSAPEFWVFCADYHRDAGLCPKADLGWTEQFLTSTLDVGICVQNAMVALESLGLGGCFIGGLRNGIAKADQALGLPENVYPVLGLAFGHPAFKNEVKPVCRKRSPSWKTATSNQMQTNCKNTMPHRNVFRHTQPLATQGLLDQRHRRRACPRTPTVCFGVPSLQRFCKTMRKGKEASENFALYLIPTFVGNDIAI